MSVANLEAKARKHWETWLPEKTKRLKEAGRFQIEARKAAVRANQTIMDLVRTQGYQVHEAEEVALRAEILLDPEEGAAVDQEQQEELDAMEADYQSWMRPMTKADE